MTEDEAIASEVVGEGGLYTPPVDDEPWELAVTTARLRELGALLGEPERLTDDELDELEREFATTDADGRYHMADRIPALIAELRRLRAQWWADHLMG